MTGSSIGTEPVFLHYMHKNYKIILWNEELSVILHQGE